LDTGLGKIETHRELFSEKIFFFFKERKRQRERKKEKIQGYMPLFGRIVELLFCPLLFFTFNNRRPKIGLIFVVVLLPAIVCRKTPKPYSIFPVTDG